MSEGEFKHFDSLYEVAVDVFLGFELALQLVDLLLHLRLFKKPFCLSRVDLSLMVFEEVYDVAEADWHLGLAVALCLTILMASN